MSFGRVAAARNERRYPLSRLVNGRPECDKIELLCSDRMLKEKARSLKVAVEVCSEEQEHENKNGRWHAKP